MPETKYESGGVKVSIDGAAVVKLKPKIFRGRLTGMLFEPDKAFLLPSSIPGIQGLKRYYDQHPGLQVLVSGHADRSGDASYNLDLSMERAKAIESFLQDKVDDWVAWYGAGKPASKRWSAREDQYMLSAIHDGAGAPYYMGPINGRNDTATQAALKRFGADKGTAAGDATRRALIEKYMATDDTTLPAGTVLQSHGCGEFHPAVATADGVMLAENRRVEIFLFEGPIDPAPPGRCPAPGCTQYPEWVKRATETVDFNADAEVTILVVDEIGLPLRNTPIKVKYPDGHEDAVETDGEGRVRPRVEAGGTLTITIDDAHEAQTGDGVTTPSGTHLPAASPAPAASAGGAT